MANERDAIEATVREYVDGIKSSDPDRVAKAFHPQATMTGHFGGQYMVVNDAGSFIADYMRKIPATSEHSPKYNVTVRSIDQQGTLASAALDENQLEGKDMKTFLILHKIDGNWRIASKGTWAPE